MASVLPVTTKSSAYRVRCTFGLPSFPLRCLAAVSMPFRVMLHRRGDIIPPCGVPTSVLLAFLPSITPDFSHCSNTDRSQRRVFLSKKSCDIVSKHFATSASNTQCGDTVLSNRLLNLVIASCVDLYLRNP